MTYALKINEKLCRIENVISGTLSRSDIVNSTAEAIEFEKIHGIYSVLLNAVDMDSVESVTDVYELPKQYIDQGASRATRIAIVMPKAEAARKAIRFYEDVCMNRGWTVRTFESQSEAEAWLSLTQS